MKHEGKYRNLLVKNKTKEEKIYFKSNETENLFTKAQEYILTDFICLVEVALTKKINLFKINRWKY